MTSSSKQKRALPLADKWSEFILKNYGPNSVSKPLMNVERHKLWETLAMFPYSFADQTYVFGGLLPDANSITAANLDIFPIHKPCSPMVLLDFPFNFNFIKPRTCSIILS
jgi:hypothetical protein